MPVVVDSSVLIGLVKIDRLEILKKLYKRVYITPSVHCEVVLEGERLHKPGVREVERALKAEWITVAALTARQSRDTKIYKAGSEIGDGEAESVALAKSLRLPIIVDDKYARELAGALGLEFLGTAAVLLEAYLNDFIDREEFMESLCDLGKAIWLSPEVITELLRISEEVKR